MKEKIDLLGAIVAHVIFISSILTFSSRMIFKLQPGHWIGIPILLMTFPLGYLLLKAPEFNRPNSILCSDCSYAGLVNHSLLG